MSDKNYLHIHFIVGNPVTGRTAFDFYFEKNKTHPNPSSIVKIDGVQYVLKEHSSHGRGILEAMVPSLFDEKGVSSTDLVKRLQFYADSELQFNTDEQKPNPTSSSPQKSYSL